MNKKRHVNILDKIGSKHLIVFLVILIIGAALVWASQFVIDPYNHVLRDIGIAFFPISIIGLAYEYFLRRSFIKTMRMGIKGVVNDRMPSSLKHLRDSGIVDAYPKLDIQNLCEHIANSRNVEIRILDIWFESLHFIKDDLLKAIIKRNCVVKILLWDMKNTDVLERRAQSLGFEDGVYTLMGHILENLKTLGSMFEQLSNCSDGDLAKNLQVKLYSSFIGISVFGVGPDYYLGFYLRERLSSMNTQLKVAGYNRHFYHQIDDHFNTQWHDELNTQFNIEHLADFKKIYLDFLAKNG